MSVFLYKRIIQSFRGCPFFAKDLADSPKRSQFFLYCVELNFNLKKVLAINSEFVFY